MQATGKFWLNFDVLPAHFQESYIAQLHDHLLKNVATFNTKKVATNARENNPARIAFLERHDYQCLMRECTSKLDVIQFDPTPFKAAIQKSRAANIALYSLAELQAHDPNWLAKLEALHWQVGCDIPSVDPPDPNSRLSLEEYQKRFERPSHMPDGWFVAVDETDGPLAQGQYVGLSYFWRILNDPTRLDTGVTGVLRSHRRKGIATTLKLRAIEFAKQYGAKTISTENEENNPMYQLNLALGFKPEPAWLEYVKVL